jgi:Fe-Mn family superoxide dismutase
VFKLPPLPYAKNALEPYISEQTIEFHYGKHHQTYVDKLNGLIDENENKSLEEIIQSSDGKVFNNAAQVWNHTFYWESLSEIHHQKPLTKTCELLISNFNSIEEFSTQFTDQALNLFGSGWVWLAIDHKNELSIVSTANAETPITQNLTPLLTCDVWEHAYYLDTQNARPSYLKNFWEVVNWAAVEERLTQYLNAQ